MGDVSPREKLAVFGRAARLLASATTFDETLATTIAACLPALGDFGFFDVLVEGSVDSGTVRRTSHAFEDPRIGSILAPTQWVRSERRDMNLCALSHGEAALHPVIDDAWYRAIAVNEGHLAVLRDLAFHARLASTITSSSPSRPSTPRNDEPAAHHQRLSRSAQHALFRREILLRRLGTTCPGDDHERC